MTYHPRVVNDVGTIAWAGGTATSICSPAAGWVASWFTDQPSIIAQATTSASSGGITLGIIGLVALAVNRVYDDRKGQREERQRIREHDEKLAKLERDLATSRDNRHREAKGWNLRLLDLQDRLAEATRTAAQAALGVNANSSGLRRLADDSGLHDVPIADPIPVALPDAAPDLAPTAHP